MTIKYEFNSHWQMKQNFPSAVYKVNYEYVNPEQIKDIIDYGNRELKFNKDDI